MQKIYRRLIQANTTRVMDKLDIKDQKIRDQIQKNAQEFVNSTESKQSLITLFNKTAKLIGPIKAHKLLFLTERGLIKNSKNIEL